MPQAVVTRGAGGGGASTGSFRGLAGRHGRQHEVRITECAVFAGAAVAGDVPYQAGAGDEIGSEGAAVAGARGRRRAVVMAIERSGGRGRGRGGRRRRVGETRGSIQGSAFGDFVGRRDTIASLVPSVECGASAVIPAPAEIRSDV